MILGTILWRSEEPINRLANRERVSLAHLLFYTGEFIVVWLQKCVLGGIIINPVGIFFALVSCQFRYLSVLRRGRIEVSSSLQLNIDSIAKFCTR